VFDADHLLTARAAEHRSGRAQRCASLRGVDMTIAVPASLKALHESLHATLKRATREADRTGAAARGLSPLLERQFDRDEVFALPTLSLLPPIAQCDAAPDTRDALRLVEQLSDKRVAARGVSRYPCRTARAGGRGRG
jgi:hypothetical protein